MAYKLELDFTPLLDALRGAGKDIGTTAKDALHDVMDDWNDKSKNLAPLDKSTLRDNIFTEVKPYGGGFVGEIHANTSESLGKWSNFNYSFYIHEVKGHIENPTTAGTIAKFLDVPAEDNEDRWMKQIEDALKEKLKRRGF